MEIKNLANQIMLHNKSQTMILRDLYSLSTILVKVSTKTKQNLAEQLLRLCS